MILCKAVYTSNGIEGVGGELKEMTDGSLMALDLSNVGIKYL